MAAQSVSFTESFRFPSRSGGKGHEVSVKIAKDGEQYVVCTCPAGRFAFAGTVQKRGCWAMQSVRQIVGL